MPKKPATTTPAEPVPAATYEVISPLNHDGEDYAIGDAVELTEKQAKALLGHTVRLPVEPEPEPEPTPA